MLARADSDSKNIIEKAQEQTELIIMQATGDDEDTKNAAQGLADSTNASAKYLADKMKLMAKNRATVIKEEIDALVEETQTMLNNFGETTAQDGWDQVAQAKLRNAKSAFEDQKNRLASLENEQEVVIANAQKKVEKWENEVQRISLLVVAAEEAAGDNGIDLSSFKKKAKIADSSNNDQELEDQLKAMDENSDSPITDTNEMPESEVFNSYDSEPKSVKKA
jgi:hypothetical protein